MNIPLLTVWPRRRFLLTGASLCFGAYRSGASEDASSNPILLWNEAFIRCVKTQSHSPALTARNLAILHLALWRTTVEAARKRVPEKLLSAALHAAAQEICRAVFPSLRAEIDALHGGALTMLGPLLPDPDFDETARQISRLTLESRSADGCNTMIPYVPRNEPGQWRRTPTAMRPPELPHWGKLTPFLVKSPSEFRPSGPPVITDPGFTADLQEVFVLGGRDSTTRTASETETALFWSDFSYTTSPPGHWNDIARSLAGGRLTTAETARLFAVLNMTLADVGIVAWDCKYHYNFWRPVTALQARGDAGWKPLLPSPPHPEYVSGHAAFSGAAAAVLEAYFKSPALPFSVVSDTVKTVTRTFHNLHDCAAEICRSRVLGGIHYSFSGRDGLSLGQKVAQWCVSAFDKL